MTSQTHRLTNDSQRLELALRALDEGLAILHAIDQADLLGEPPAALGARARHQSAVTLIDLLRWRLQRVREDLVECAPSKDDA